MLSHCSVRSIHFCLHWVVSAVSDFAKKTGDFQVLSATDVHVMALTHQLLVESGSAAAGLIRETPVTATQGAATVMQPTTVSGHTAGFYMPKNKVGTAEIENGRGDVRSESIVPVQSRAT